MARWLLAPWYRWDALWFLKIAREGYIVDDGRSGNYPLYPFFVRLVGDLLGHNYLLSGLIVSNVALWLALIVLFVVVSRRYGYAVARNTLIALALYPAFFFNLGYYAESLLLLFTIATFYALETNRWGWVGIFSSLAVLAKLPGVILFAPIAWEFWRRRRSLFSRDVVALVSIPVTLTSWTIIRRYLIGSEMAIVDLSSPLGILGPLLSSSYQQTYGASVVWPWEGVWMGIQAVGLLWGRVMGLKVTFDLAVLIFFTLLMPFVWRLPAFYAIYTMGLYIMNLVLVVNLFPLANFPRRMMMAFPVFIVLAISAQHHRLLRWSMLVIGGVLSLVLSACFVWWLWVG